MTKDQFLNSWAKELAIESTMSDIDAKKFIHAFYDKVIGFHSAGEEVSEEDAEAIDGFISDIKYQFNKLGNRYAEITLFEEHRHIIESALKKLTRPVVTEEEIDKLYQKHKGRYLVIFNREDFGKLVKINCESFLVKSGFIAEKLYPITKL